eukprot:Nitzschia sp. Nitz4//scaffold196_size54656//32361//37667//NITZ4_006643-RA/size54656-processed-gene-0.53-mRNA-1//1//CDS//3329540438//8660//frame0
MEVPLVLPNHVHKPRRYKVSADGFQLVDSSGPLSRNGSVDIAPVVEEAFPGSASVSEVLLGGTTCLLTTCVKLDNPNVLSVALSPMRLALNAWDESPRMLELDCAPLALQTFVKVQAFAQNARIQLNLVDSEGTVVALHFDLDLAPEEVHVLRTSDYIESPGVLQEVTGSELQSTMVAFVSPSVVILALSPFLLSLDIPRETSVVWSETQCLEDMRSRTTSFGNFFSNVTDLLVGKLDQGLMDMAPTAALCLSSTTNPLLDAVYCVTVHSDATVRKWKVGPSYPPLPIEVVTLSSGSTPLPVPSSWSANRNSVAVACRIYEPSFAVALHIKTAGYIDDGDSPPAAGMASDCHLRVIHGDLQDIDGSRATNTILKVPRAAKTLVGMNFDPTSSRCSLGVLFESIDEAHSTTSTLAVTYPPSFANILSSTPIVLQQSSLDAVAMTERTRIQSLSIAPVILEEMPDATVDEAIHALDAQYLKLLFRPLFPRGTGTVQPPSEACIRRALAKLVHSVSKDHGRSIELDTIRVMHEWRYRDNRKIALGNMASPRRVPVPAESPMALAAGENGSSTLTSVYDAFAQDCMEEDDIEESEQLDALPMEDPGEDGALQSDFRKSAQVDAHEHRWRRLLLQIWEEERIYRLPLGTEWLVDQRCQVTVRMGLVTLTTPVSDGGTSGDWKTLFDRIAMKILRRIELDRRRFRELCSLEQKLTKDIAEVDPGNSKTHEYMFSTLNQLARWADAAEIENDPNEVSIQEHQELEDAARQLTPSMLVEWIQAAPLNVPGYLPELGVFGGNGNGQSSQNDVWSNKPIANYQLRHAACSLSLRCIDAVRRLQLGRCLLLSELVRADHASQAAFRAFYQSIAMLWVSSQRVPIPMTAFQQRHVRLDTGGASSPPNKRLSYGDDATSVLAPLVPSMTTVLDVVTIELSQSVGAFSVIPLSFVGVPLFLVQSYFRKAFQNQPSSLESGTTTLPELAALPRPKDGSNATDYPRLALRLLIPHLVTTLSEDPKSLQMARKESLAECLLIESHATTSAKKMHMREKACELLVPESPFRGNDVEREMVKKALDALRVIRNSVSGVQVHKHQLETLLQERLVSAAPTEVTRLAELESVKELFSPITAGAGADVDNVTRASIDFLAVSLLHLSRVLHRLSILENHIVGGNTEENENPTFLLGLISNAITDMGNVFPEEFRRSMPEYGKLWSRLFHHAILAHQWHEAYSACLNNPNIGLRESMLCRLVRAMVDQGALSSLLVLCTQMARGSPMDMAVTDTSAANAVDLYEIASDYLGTVASPHDMYAVRATSPDPSGLSHYQGALYALHVSQKNWRRAAQSMDVFYQNAKQALGSNSANVGANVQSGQLRDGLIVNDLVLASLGAHTSIELVKENSNKFLVGGEYGPYIAIPVKSETEGNVKRARGDNDVDDMETDDEENRLSKLMGVVALEGRAVQSIALRALFYDRSTNPAFVSNSFLQQPGVSMTTIKELFASGYVQLGLVLAESWAKNAFADTGSRKPEGSDLFHESLCHVLETSIIPVAVQSMTAASRPTLNQLQLSLQMAGNHTAYVVPEKSGSTTTVQAFALRDAAMLLTRKLTMMFSTAETPVAVEVAASILDQGVSQLPCWLERFLLGADVASENGLFAVRPQVAGGLQGYSGNPTALFALYVRYGMFTEACDVVSFILEHTKSGERSPSERAVSRLPEKGEIDYVPYKKIDELWSLIAVVLKKGVLGTTEEKRVTGARDRMKVALEGHFSRLKVSESGLRSARALRT